MSLVKRGQTYHADITIPGQTERFRGTLGTADKREAQRLHDELRARLHQRARQPRSWYDAVELWLQQGERSLSDRSALRKYNPGDVPLAELKAEDFGIGHHKPETYRKYANLFRAILRLAQKAGWIQVLPEFPKRKLPPGRVRFLTKDEWARLYGNLPEHLKAPALFAISTGLRQSNVFGMEWDRVDLNRGVCWIPAPRAKGAKAIGIPLSASAINALQSVLGQHNQYCFTYAGRRIGSPKTGFHSALKKAEIEDFRWHDFRHTFASWHMQAGTPIEVLQRLGAWEGLDMVLRYAHLAPDHLKAHANNVQFTTQ